MNLMDIIEPVMLGPSSSHTAGAVNALTSADMTSAGIFSKIPPDEVIGAMRSIGKSMSEDIRETGKGGLAGTPTGIRITDRMARLEY